MATAETHPVLRGALIGVAALIAISSAAAATATARHFRPVEPPIWIANPLGLGAGQSLVWHASLAAIFGAAAALCGCNITARLWRTVTASSLAILSLLALTDAIRYYKLLAIGQVATTLPIPLSAFVSIISGTIAVCTWRGWRLPSFRNCGACAIAAAAAAAGAAALALVHIVTFGTTDYRRQADVAIVLGAKVHSDGTPSTSLEDRLRTGIELYESGRVSYLLMTGGTGVEGCNEALAMRDFAVAAGVPEDRIFLDTHGINTLESARNCRQILQEHELGSALLVSHYFHLARCKMLFSEQGIRCVTVPAQMSQRLRYEPYYLARECAAYLAYCVARPWREMRQ